jgi:hypothetical protein
MGEPHEKNTRCKVLFWFSLQGGLEGSKKSFILSFPWVGRMNKTLEINFCFGLVCKVVVEVFLKIILFICMGWSHE